MHILTELLLVVFLALAGAWLALDLARKLRRPREEASRPSPMIAAPAKPEPFAHAVALSPAPAPPPARDADPSPPAAHLVAIAAAVHHLFQGRARLASVTAAGRGEILQPVDWAREGRRDIFTSRRVR